ncbi:MAG TPA: ribonuclease III [Acidobacteriaceae bacterium]|nr:ribonuclease III [Acidobacteriaceae bacterium]
MESPAHDPGVPGGALSADEERIPLPARLEDLEIRLGHSFNNRRLLEQALTHRSLTREGTRDRTRESAAAAQSEDNERMEFLGDAVVGLAAAESLYLRYPELSEGDLTRLRGALVGRRHLGQVARQLDLGRYLLLGRSEENSGGRAKPALLANAMEAMLGALFLDAGLDAVRRVVDEYVVGPPVDALRRQLLAGEGIGDYKSGLQELLQARRRGQPEYSTTAENGPDHCKQFFVEVRCAGHVLATGAGLNRKLAEQEAARRALEMLRESAE